MIMLQKLLKVVFGLFSAAALTLGVITAIGGVWETAVFFGIAAIVFSLWEVATGLDILISQNDNK